MVLSVRLIDKADKAAADEITDFLGERDMNKRSGFD